MTWRIDDIKAAYDEGVAQGATHMLVAYDSFDHENYPIYVMPGENPLDKKPTNGDRVDECYRMSLGWAAQSHEKRANHWEYDEIAPEKKILGTENLMVSMIVNFTSGIELPFTLPAREGPIMAREEKKGTVFLSLEELEDLHSTAPFSSFILVSEEAGQALEDAGWATRQTRGGYVATEEFRNSSIMSELFVKAEPVWEKQRSSRVEAILSTFSIEDFQKLAQIVRPS